MSETKELKRRKQISNDEQNNRIKTVTMDMTSTAEASRWYGNQRLPGSPNTALSAHQNAGGSAGSVDASEMSAYYALENSNAHRRYYSAAAGYNPHSKY